MTSQSSSSRTNTSGSSAASFQNPKYDKSVAASSAKPSGVVSHQTYHQHGNMMPPLSSNVPQYQMPNSFLSHFSNQQQPMTTLPSSKSHNYPLQQLKHSGPGPGPWQKSFEPNLATSPYSNTSSQPQVKYSGPGSWQKSLELNLPTSQHSNTSSPQQHMTLLSNINISNNHQQQVKYFGPGSWRKSLELNLPSSQHSNTSSQKHMTSSGLNPKISIEQQRVTYYEGLLWDYLRSNPSTLQNFNSMTSFNRVVDDGIISTNPSSSQQYPNILSYKERLEDMIKSTVNSTLQQYPSNNYSHEEILDYMIKSIHHSISQQLIPHFEEVVVDDIESD